MTRQEFDKWAIGKSKREIIAILPQNTIITTFVTRKGKIQMMSICGGEWVLYTHLHFDKKTQRVVEAS